MKILSDQKSGSVPNKQLSEDLTDWFAEYQRVFVLFSGGVDSTVVLKAAIESLGSKKVSAITAVSPSLAKLELEDCRDICRLLDVEHVTLLSKELDNPSYRANRGDRCFFCKTTFYEALTSYLSGLALPNNAATVDGVNLDDIGQHRPGHLAAARAGVLHPLVELGIKKSQVRELARCWNLPNWDKPATACLASRIPAGIEVTEDKLSQVEKAENILSELGFSGSRVRYHPISEGLNSANAAIGRIEIPAEQFAKIMDLETRSVLIARIKQAGFSHVVLDLEGYQLGGGINKLL